MRKLDVFAAYWSMATGMPFEDAKERFERACVQNPGMREKLDGEISSEEGMKLLEALVDGTEEAP
jgi:hypothetical protein